MKHNIKRLIYTALFGAIAVFLAGCQNDQLDICRQENLTLQKTIDEQQAQIQQLSSQQEIFAQVTHQFISEAEKLEKQLVETERELEQLKRLRKKQEMAPEDKEKMIKSLEELKKARQIRAERMKQQQQDEE